MRKFSSIFILFVLLIASVYQCKDKVVASFTRYVQPVKGLNMRDSASIRGALIVTIPFNSKVEVIEEAKKLISVAGKRGKWAKVKFNAKTGWVFDAFLVREKVSKVKAFGVKYKVHAVCEGESTQVNFASDLYLILKGDQFDLRYVHCEGLGNSKGKIIENGNMISIGASNLKFQKKGNQYIPEDPQQANAIFFQCGQCKTIKEFSLMAN